MSQIKLIINDNGLISLDLSEKLNIIAAKAMLVNNNKNNIYININICDNNVIKEINRECRGIDRATDVLSFPTIKYIDGIYFKDLAILPKDCYDLDERAYFLGDIIISIEKVKEQANEYGHSLEREFYYLFTHGLCHLMGYDHMVDNDKKIMRNMEELILKDVFEINKDELIKRAYEAMKNSYAPYSKFKVGACILSENNEYYCGCNVENSSYGLTNCAERTAVFKAISEGVTKFKALAIVAEKAAPWPCGACRQVLSEFCDDIPVYISWAGNNYEESSLFKLLPHSFSPSNGVSDLLGKE